ncbi:MAG: DUF5706 domain-containing protein [Lysobacterales bacterium]
MTELEPRATAFSRIPERPTADNLLRTTQQHHVGLSAMADTKANIIITVSSIVLTLVLGRANDPSVRAAALVLAAFTLLALLLAILAVLPKYQRRAKVGEARPDDFNVLFFGHFAGLSRSRFIAEMQRVLTPDGSPYAAWVDDIHSLGCYLAEHKYRYLRWSYLFFLAGFVLACVTQVFQLAR